MKPASSLASRLACAALVGAACGDPRGVGADAAPAASLPAEAIGLPDLDAGAARDAGPGDAARDADPGDAGPDAEAPLPDCPEGMAKVGRSCVDRFEAHLVTADADGGLAVFSHVARPAPGVRYEARSSPGVFPQAYVSRVEAKAACEAAGKRLCSRREWTRACEGKRAMTFPYGRRAVAGRCNSGKPHLLAAMHGSDPRKWRYDEHFNDPHLGEEPGFLARSGDYDGCVGEEGVGDLVGNLHEWVSDTVDPDFIERFEAEETTRRKQPWKEGNGVFMGGFFSTTDQHGPGCTFTTIAHEPSYHDYSIGFRCCAAARPAPAPPPKARGAGRGPVAPGRTPPKPR